MIIPSKVGGVITLGYEGENNAREYHFDITRYQRAWPDGTPQLLITRSDGENYIAETRVEGAELVWLVKNSDLACPGQESMLIAFVNSENELLGYTEETTLIVVEMPEWLNAESPPPAYEPWIVSILLAGDNALTGASEAKASAEQAARSESAAATSAENAANSNASANESKTASAASATAAAQSAASADLSRNAAASSAQSAATNASIASTSATQAQGYAQRAETAKTGAEESKNAAAESAIKAAQSAFQAGGYVDTVVAASQAASDAAISAKASETSASTAASAAAASASDANASKTASAQSASSAQESRTAAANSASAAASSESKAKNSADSAASSASSAAQVLADVNTAGDAQVAAIEQKGAQTLATIPEDYTALAGDVSSLKDHIAKVGADVSLWERGNIGTNTGVNLASYDWLRTFDYLPESIESVTSENLRFVLFAYNNGEFVGAWRPSDGAFVTTGTVARQTIDIKAQRTKYPEYDFKLACCEQPLRNLVVSDAEAALFTKRLVAYSEDVEALSAIVDANVKKTSDLDARLFSTGANPSLWESGYYNFSTGDNTAAATWMRTVDYLADDVVRIDGGDLLMVMGAFKSGRYVGAWDSAKNTFVTTGVGYSSAFDLDYIKAANPGYDLVVSFKRSDGASMSGNEAESVIITLAKYIKEDDAKRYADNAITQSTVRAVPTGGQVSYIADTKAESSFIRNAIAYRDGTIIACRAGGEVVRIGYDGNEETLLDISGDKMDWRCLYMDSKENVYCSPHASWGNVTQGQRGLYRLTKGAAAFEMVLSLYNPSSSVETETQANDDTIWTMCEDDQGNLYAGVYAHTVRANPSIYKSTDGGLTWSLLVDMRTYISTGMHIHSIIYSKWQKALYCIVGEYNSIFKSTDGGVTWIDLAVRLDAKGSALLATKDGIFIGSDGTMLRIDWLKNDDVTHETVFKGWANTIFAIRQSDLTGFLYAFTKIDSSVNNPPFPPVDVLNGTMTIEEWRDTVAAGTYNTWKKFHDEIIDTYPEDAIRPQHYGVIVSRDGGLTWEVLDYIKCSSTSANGFWTIGYFFNGEILAGVQEDYEIMRPVVISEGKHKYAAGGCNLDGDIFVRTNTSSVVETI